MPFKRLAPRCVHSHPTLLLCQFLPCYSLDFSHQNLATAVPNFLHIWIFFNTHTALRGCRQVTREPLVAPSWLQGRAQLVATANADAWGDSDRL